MSGDYWSPQMLVVATVGITIAFGPVIALTLARRVLGSLNAAAGLAIWGAMMVVGEHANFAIANALNIAETPGVSAHTRYHFFMAGIYTIVGAVFISIVAYILLREGRRVGWYGLLFALLFGGGLELLGGGGIFVHGLPPHSIPVGLALYAYFAAWGSALVIAYEPVFKAAT